MVDTARTSPSDRKRIPGLVAFPEVFNAELDEIARRRARLAPPSKVETNGTGKRLTVDHANDIAETLKQATGVGEAIAEIQRRDDTQRVDVAVNDLTGIALSGGGIRSAAFSLGAVQALDVTLAKRAEPTATEHTLFEQMDYMSTVSGGGYIGCSISAAMAEPGTEFPYSSQLAKDEPPVLQHVRDGSNYLFPKGGPMEFFSNLAAYLRGVFANVPVVASVVLAIAALTITLKPTSASLEEPRILWWKLDEILGRVGLGSIAPGHGFWVISSATALIVVFIFILWAALRSNREVSVPDYRALGTKAMAILLMFLLGVLFVELQPKMIDAIGRLESTLHKKAVSEPGQAAGAVREIVQVTGQGSTAAAEESNAATSEPAEGSNGKKASGNAGGKKDFYEQLLSWVMRITGFLTAISALVAAVKVFFGLGEAAPARRSGLPALFARYSKRAIYFLAGLPLPLLFWLSYLYLSYWGIQVGSGRGLSVLVNAADFQNTPTWLVSVLKGVAGNSGIENAMLAPWTAYLAVAGVLAILAWLMTANANSPYNLYRDRLAATFLVRRTGGANVTPLAGCKLSEIGGGVAPFHLINAAVNLQSSHKANKRGRNAGFFTFSKTHVGCDETEYVATSDAQEVEDGFTLGSAMAVSAAAASTAMGSGTMKPLALTLAVLNVRLGYWFTNPKQVAKIVGSQSNANADLTTRAGNYARQKLAGMKPANWVNAYSYLGREILGRMDEDRPLVYLSDGGHIENLGLYTLLKRRCKFIVVVDAEADPEMSFGSFVTAQRYARIDLGTRIDIRYETIAESALKAREELSKGDNSGLEEKRPHAAIGTIEYPNKQTGILLYVKLSMTGDENDYVREYARTNSAFPHETTGDQFFSEEQFEVYRALGFHAMFGSLHGELNVETKSGLQKLNRHASKTDAAIKQFQKLFPSIGKK